MGQFQVRAWGGPYTSYEQAFTNGGYCSGVSTIITMATGNPTNAAPTAPASLVAGGFQGFPLGQSPIIVVPPTNQSAGVGRTAVFSVVATGTAPLSYQWQFNGTNLTDSAHINGSLTNVLTIFNVQTNDAGSYQIVVTNLYGVTTSPNAVLTTFRICMPPPAGLIGWWKGEGNGMDSAGGNNAYALQNIGFTNGIVGQAFANDPENYPDGTYNGVRIADQPAYVLTNSLTLEGWIRVRGVSYTVFFRGDSRPGLDPYVMGPGGFQVTDANGNYANVSTPLVYNQWYHLAGTLDDASGELSLYTNGVLAVQTTTAVRPFGNLIPGDSPGIGIANVNDGFNNFPFWGDIDEFSLYNRALTAGEIQGIYNAYNLGKCLTCPPVITANPTNLVLTPGSTAVFSVLAGGSPVLGCQWTFNGTYTLAATTAALTIPNVQLTNAGTYQVVITNTYGSITSAVATLIVAVPPQIITQPANQTVCVGGTTTFSVSATGTAPLSYQWRFNGTNMAGATVATLTIPNAQLTDAGSYRVVVTNAYGSATSAVATLSVSVPPQITVQPTNRAVLAGKTATFAISASGTAPVSYQWWFNGTTPLAATAATLTLPNVQLTNAGNYNVVVSNNCGQAASVAAYLSVALPPLFQSVTVRTGTLTMTWNGATGFTYQVQYKTNLIQLYWSNLGSPIFAMGNIVTGYDVLSADRQRFYRVVLLP